MSLKTKNASAPKGLAPEEVTVWNATVEKYELDEAQLSGLEQALRLLTGARAFDAIVKKEGPVIITSKGAREHPASVGARQNRNSATGIMRGLGLFRGSN